MKATVSIIILIILFSSFKSDTTCLKKLLLDINLRNTVEKQFDDLSKNKAFNVKTNKSTFKKEKVFECYYAVKTSVFKNYDSILIAISESIGGDINDARKTIKIKMIDLSVYFSDSLKLSENYKFITEKFCKDIPFNKEMPLYDKNHKIIGVGRECSLSNNSYPAIDVSASYDKLHGPVMYIMYVDIR